ncbi:MAG: hypothetical protein OXF02_00685 [Simkaniaceae bacterium]|nr:hypothetical protein [Simkaniaceae bacterium]
MTQQTTYDRPPPIRFHQSADFRVRPRVRKGRCEEVVENIEGISVADLPEMCPGRKVAPCPESPPFPDKEFILLIVRTRSDKGQILRALREGRKHLCEACVENYEHVHAQDLKRCDVQRPRGDPHIIPVALIVNGLLLRTLSGNFDHLCLNCVHSSPDHIPLRRERICPPRGDGSHISLIFLTNDLIKEVVEALTHVCQTCDDRHFAIPFYPDQPKNVEYFHTRGLPPLDPLCHPLHNDPDTISVAFFSDSQIELAQSETLPLSMDIVRRQPHRHESKKGGGVLCGPYGARKFEGGCPRKEETRTVCPECSLIPDPIKAFTLLVFDTSAQREEFIRKEPHLCMSCLRKETGPDTLPDCKGPQCRGMHHIHRDLSSKRCYTSALATALDIHSVCVPLLLKSEVELMDKNGMHIVCPDCVRTYPRRIILKNWNAQDMHKPPLNRFVALAFPSERMLDAFFEGDHVCGSCSFEILGTKLYLIGVGKERKCGPDEPSDTSPTKEVSLEVCDPKTITVAFFLKAQQNEMAKRWFKALWVIDEDALNMGIIRSQPHLHEEADGTIRFCGAKYPYRVELADRDKGTPPRCIPPSLLPTKFVSKCPYAKAVNVLRYRDQACKHCLPKPRADEFPLLRVRSEGHRAALIRSKQHIVCMDCIHLLGAPANGAATGNVPIPQHFASIRHTHRQSAPRKRICRAKAMRDLDVHDMRVPLVTYEEETSRIGRRRIRDICHKCVHHFHHILVENISLREWPYPDIVCLFANTDRIERFRELGRVKGGGHLCGRCVLQAGYTRSFIPANRLACGPDHTEDRSPSRDIPFDVCDPETITVALFLQEQISDTESGVLQVDMGIIRSQPHIHEDGKGGVWCCGFEKACRVEGNPPRCIRDPDAKNRFAPQKREQIFRSKKKETGNGSRTLRLLYQCLSILFTVSVFRNAPLPPDFHNAPSPHENGPGVNTAPIGRLGYAPTESELQRWNIPRIPTPFHRRGTLPMITGATEEDPEYDRRLC